MEKKGNAPRGIKNEILSLREKGFTYREIQKKLNCSKSTINFHCKRHDLTDTGMKVYPIDETTKKGINKFSKTHTKKETMKKFGVGRTTVKRYKAKSETN